LINLIEEVRESQFFDIYSILSTAVQKNIEFTYKDVRELCLKFGKNNELYFPEIIAEFVSNYLSDRNNIKILDPWSRIGSFINPVLSAIPSSKGTGLSINNIDLQVSNYLGCTNINMIYVQKSDLLESLEEQEYDVVVSCPPFNLGPKDSITIVNNGKEVLVKDFLNNLIILKSAILLSKEGIAFYVVPSNFFIDSVDSNVKNSFDKFGLYINAVFSLPSGTFSPYTSIPTNLIAISRKKTEKLFIAELRKEYDFGTIINNWKNHKPSKIFSLGAFVEPSKFESFERFAKEQEIYRLAKLSGLPQIKLLDIVIEINRENKNLEFGFNDNPNSIYLPLIGYSEALTNLSSLKLKAQNYIQIQLDSNKALAEYVARFYNTSFGKTLRESIFSGVTIPKISKKNLEQSHIYLPNLDDQIKSVEAQLKIQELRSQINSYENRLWNKPQNSIEVLKELSKYNTNKGLEEWVETLPFPLASILWRYLAEDDLRNKKDLLLFFFEAYVQFTVTIMLSAYKVRDDFEKLKETLFLIEEADYIKKSSFGTWVTLGERLAKMTRTLLSNPEMRDECIHMYRRKRADFVEIITSKKVFEILRKTSEYRNRWKGHGGIEGKEELINRVTLLKKELTNMWATIGNAFEGSILLRPEEMKYSKGIFQNKVECLMGTRSIFKKENIETIVPLDNERLFFIEEGHLEPLELVPLIKFMSSPSREQNACYFYNRLEKDGVRWVSYHFEKEADVVVHDDKLESFLTSLFE